MNNVESNAILRTAVENGYELLEEIGKGGYGHVYRVNHIGYQKIFAMKVIKIIHANAVKVQTYTNEISSLSNIIHTNIIAIYNFFKDEKYIYIILDYCSNGSLADLILKNGPMEENEIKRIMKPVLEAIDYLHNNKISHGDIKPANVLFDQYNRPKITDFGLADFHHENDCLKKTFCCTPAYAAPEILLKIPYDPYKADIWAIGVTIYQMYTGQLPCRCSSINELVRFIQYKDTWFLNNQIMSKLIKMAIANDPNERCTALEILNCPFFNEEDSSIQVESQSSARRNRQVRQLMNISGPAKSFSPISTKMGLNLAVMFQRKVILSKGRIKSTSVGPQCSNTFKDHY